jgi:two-component system sensor histidine kinase SenX3
MMEDQSSSPELLLFLASTVHDMKNSVSVVSGTLESLLAAPATSGEAVYGHAQLAMMLYESKRMNDKLIQLLALYKQVGKPGYPFEVAPQMVNQLIEQVVAQEKVLLASRNITLETDCPADLIRDYDEDLLIGVLGNAINNAIRYTRDTIRLSAAEVDGWLELRVEDNGAGFTPAMIAAGLDAMRSNTSGVNFSTNSTGLGLYFSSVVAQMHKHRGRTGSIALENGGALGGGSFVVRLP